MEASGSSRASIRVSRSAGRDTDPLRVLICADQELWRLALNRLLSDLPGYEVVAELSRLDQIRAEARPSEADLLIAELPPSPQSAVPALRAIHADHAKLQILLISPVRDCAAAAQFLADGAHAVVLKHDDFSELRQALGALSRGRSYVCESMRLDVRNSSPRDELPLSTYQGPLSPRELEVLACIADGMSTRETAAELELSVKTIETHRSRIMDKLDTRHVAGLTKYALREGLTNP